MASNMRLIRPLRQLRYMCPAVTSLARPASIIAAQNRRFNSTDATENTNTTTEAFTENTNATTEAFTEAHDIIKATTELIAEATEAIQGPKINETTESSQQTVETSQNGHPRSKYRRGWANEARHRLRNINDGKFKYGNLPEHVEAQLRAVNQFFGSNWLSMVAGREGFVSRGAFDKQTVAYGDMDISVRRVNAAALSRYADTSRMNWFTWFMHHEPPKRFWANMTRPSTVELLLTRQVLEFRHGITFPDRLTVMHKMAVQPNANKSQIPTQIVVFSEEQRRIVARVQEQLLFVQKGQQKQSGPLPKQAHVTLEKWWDQQVKTSLEAEKTIDTFHEMLGKLEAELPHDFWAKKPEVKEEVAERPNVYTLPDLE
ncbi:hypothetical protein FSARC_503 [Fusarium sarcochroum]|uniref:Uncharacterized protein n=1 Tax=Fusarium sarcochroum TaxID=1208366 RepID=A0A8H4XGE5_9HYPO|nr:hypothetical protein FSARC_503 [Fusarium sarcochroum]